MTACISKYDMAFPMHRFPKWAWSLTAATLADYIPAQIVLITFFSLGSEGSRSALIEILVMDNSSDYFYERAPYR